MKEQPTLTAVQFLADKLKLRTHSLLTDGGFDLIIYSLSDRNVPILRIMEGRSLEGTTVTPFLNRS